MAEKTKLQIPEDRLTALGIDVDYLRQNDPTTIEALEAGRKTKLLSFIADFGGQKIPTAAKVHLWEGSNGEVVPFVHTVRPTVSMKALQAMGYEVTQDEAGMLINEKNGMLPYPVSLKFGDKEIDCLVGVDLDTREIVFKPITNVYVPEKILGVDISEEQRNIVKNGGKIFLEGLSKNDSKPFDTVLSYHMKQNNGEGGILFNVPNPKLMQEIRVAEGKSEGKDENVKKTIEKVVKEKRGAEKVVKEKVTKSVAAKKPRSRTI